MQHVLKTVLEFYNEYKTSEPDHNERAKYQVHLHELVDNVWGIPKQKNFSECYPELFAQIANLLSELDTMIVLPESRERYYSEKDDSTYLKAKKFFKKAFFHISKLPFYATNLFREDKRPISYWNHSVPLKNLATYHFRASLIVDFQEVSSLFFLKNRCSISFYQKVARRTG